MQFNPKLSHQGLILISVPLIFELLFVGVLIFMLRQAHKEVRRESCARSVIEKVTEFTKVLPQGAAIGYDTTAGRKFVGRFCQAIEPIPGELAELEDLGGYDKEQLAKIHRFRRRVVKLKSESEKGRSLLEEGQTRAGIQKLENLTALLADTWQDSDEMVKLVREIERDNPAVQAETREKLEKLMIAGVLFNVLLAVFLSLYFYRGTVRRLKNLMVNAVALANRQPLNPPLAGDDEIAEIDKVFTDVANQLAEVSRRERAIVENAQDVICSINQDGEFIALSPACLKNWGYNPDELVGKKMVSLILPEDVNETSRALEQIMAGAVETSFENSIKTEQGSVVNVLWSIRWSEQDKQLFCVAHDITARKASEDLLRESESRVRQMIENVPVGILIIDEDGTVKFVNPRTVQMFGYSSHDLLGKHIIKLFPAYEDPNKFMKMVYPKCLGHVEELRANGKEGREVQVEFLLNVLHSGEGLQLMAILLDVTQRYEIQQMRQAFVGMVSHELKTPLTSVSGFLDLLAMGAFGELSDQAREGAEQADRNVTRLINLINDLLGLQKLESGTFNVNPQIVGLRSLVEPSLNSVKVFADERQVNLSMVDTDFEVYADSERIVQVIVNFLSNAIKFSPAGSTVKLEAEEMKDFVEIAVLDEGPGVPEQYRSTIFEPFLQAPTGSDQPKGGTGLGLAICKSIVEKHGGEIGVESDNGGGSRFWFRLPRKG